MVVVRVAAGVGVVVVVAVVVVVVVLKSSVSSSSRRRRGGGGGGGGVVALQHILRSRPIIYQGHWASNKHLAVQYFAGVL